MRAGLVPALRAGALAGSAVWYVAQLLPGCDPFDALATALRPLAVDPPDDLAGLLATDDADLLATLDLVLPDDHDLLLVIDQFEELWTQLADDEVRRRFLALLARAVTDPRSRVRAVVTLRADYYDRPLASPEIAELVRVRTEAVVPLTAAELDRAVRGPAERVGVTVDRDLVAHVVADVAAAPAGLPLLQYALTEVFDRRTDGRLTTDDYRGAGGITGALARRAEAELARLPTDGREAVRQLFLRLVTPGEGAGDTRRRVEVAEVEALAPDAMPAVLAAFGSARLLTFDRDPESRAPTVEVAHEALLREWRRLRGWIDAARDDLRLHQRLRSAAEEWRAADRDPSFLRPGAAWTASPGGGTPRAWCRRWSSASSSTRRWQRAPSARRRRRRGPRASATWSGGRCAGSARWQRCWASQRWSPPVSPSSPSPRRDGQPTRPGSPPPVSSRPPPRPTSTSTPSAASSWRWRPSSVPGPGADPCCRRQRTSCTAPSARRGWRCACPASAGPSTGARTARSSSRRAPRNRAPSTCAIPAPARPCAPGTGTTSM